MALGQQRDDDVADDLRPDLDRIVDRARDTRSHLTGRLHLGGGERPSPVPRTPSPQPATVGRPERAGDLEDRPGDVGLGGARNVQLVAGGDHRDLVLERVEADSVGRDVVDDDRVEALAGELLTAVVERALAVLCGEADQRLVLAAALASALSTSVVASMSIVSASRPDFFSLPAAGSRGRKSATAAAMISRSQPGNSRSQASASSAAEPTST